MVQLARILAVLDGTDADAAIVAKAVALAHQHGATLELFLCDAQSAYWLLHAYDQSGVEESRRKCVRDWQRYVECLRDIAVGADVPISTDVACESPLYEGIVRKVLRSRCDLVVKNATGAHGLRRFAWDANDWQLMRSCPATLLLSRGKSWQACPKFAAAVDVSEEETLELPEAIVRTSALLSIGCHGELDILYSEPGDVEPCEHEMHVKTLEMLTRTASPGATTVRILSGNAEEELPAFAARHGYDAFILGALTHRKGLAALVGTLTARLVETLDCDFVLVKPDSYRTQVESTIPATQEPELEAVLPEPVLVDPALVKPRPVTALGYVSAWQLRER